MVSLHPVAHLARYSGGDGGYDSFRIDPRRKRSFSSPVADVRSSDRLSSERALTNGTIAKEIQADLTNELYRVW